MKIYAPKYCKPGNNPVGWYVHHVTSGGLVAPSTLRCDTEEECAEVCARYNAIAMGLVTP